MTSAAYGVWVSMRANPESELAFATKPADDVLPVWRAVLPADSALAAAQLSAAEAQLAASQQDLSDAASHLETLAATDAVAFGLAEQAADARSALANRARTAVEQLVRVANQSNAVVQTEVDGTLVARTLLSWTCDQRTVWLAGCTSSQMALHCRAVDLAIASRASLLASAGVVLRAAARVATLVSVPGAPLLMLPALVHALEQLQRTTSYAVRVARPVGSG